MARDRSGQTIDAITGRSTLKAGDLTEHLWLKLGHRALLVTDTNAAYSVFTHTHGIAYPAVNLSAGERVRSSAAGTIHVQNVNAYHWHFWKWLARFHGLASRRLPTYLPGPALGTRWWTSYFCRTIAAHCFPGPQRRNCDSKLKLSDEG